MSHYFPKPYEPFDGYINIKVDLSNYATKTDIKNISQVDISSYALKSNLASLENEVDKLDINKLKILPNHLSNLKSKVDQLGIDKLAPVPVDLSNVVKNEVVKKTDYNAQIKNIEDEIPDVTSLVTKTIPNTKTNCVLNQFKTEIPSISGLAITSALTTVENKIPNVSNLVKKTDHDTKVNEIQKRIADHNHDKYITTPEFNKLATGNFAARLAQANVVTKADFDNKLSNLNRKITLNKTKHLLIENELKKLETFYLIYFCGKSHFEDDGTQNWLVFQPIQSYFKTANANDSNILSWKFKILSEERIKPPTTSIKSLIYH